MSIGDLYCPDCDSSRVVASQRLSPLNWLFHMFGRQPYKCLDCRKRFLQVLPEPDTSIISDEKRKTQPEPLRPLWPEKLSSTKERLAAAPVWAFLWKIRYAPAVGAALVVLYFTIPRRPAPLSLKLEGDGAQVKITWNRAAGAVQSAQTGEIQVDEDGATTQIDLDPDLLRTGAVVYLRKSKTVAVRMQVGNLTEKAAFVSATAPQADQDALQEAETAQRKLQGQADQISRLEEMVQQLEKEKSAPKEPVAAPVPAPAPPRVTRAQKMAPPSRNQPRSQQQRPLRANRSPAPSSPAVLARAPKSEPELVAKNEPINRVPEGSVVLTAPVTPPTLSRTSDVPVAPPPAEPARIEVVDSQPVLSAKVLNRPPDPAPSRTLPPSPPRTGTMIWTGRLPKNGALTIDGRRPSTGALTGEVPGFPVQVRVYPADLTGGGLTVYTAERAHTADYVEPPGPRNGWNRTMYQQDPRRARALKVVEQPRSENGWKRLVLKGGASPLSVVLIEWSAIPHDTNAR